MSAQIINHWATFQPSKPAVVHNGNPISYSSFARAIADARVQCAAEGLVAGATVAIIIRDLVDGWVAMLALQSLGMATVCIRSSELFDVLELGPVACIVTTDAELPRLHERQDLASGDPIIALCKPVYVATEVPLGEFSFAIPAAGGHILYTSGTTGTYKKLWFANALQAARNEKGKRLSNIHEATVYHAINFGLWTAVGHRLPLRVWEAGGTVVFDQRDNWFDYLLGSGVTHTILTPSMADELLAACNTLGDQTTERDFRLVVSSGFVSWGTAQKLLRYVSSNVINHYGSTETLHGGLFSKITCEDDLYWLEVSPETVVEIVDEQGDICDVGEVGEIRIALSELDCAEYMNNPEATAKVFKHGYFYPGDMAVRRADGRIRVVGRGADVLNLKGQKHAVAPIEQNIQDILQVSAACLFSGLNDAGQSEVVVAIEAQQWPESARLDALGEELSESFEQVRFAVVYPFPRTQTGTNKVNRAALRTLIFPEE